MKSETTRQEADKARATLTKTSLAAIYRSHTYRAQYLMKELFKTGEARPHSNYITVLVVFRRMEWKMVDNRTDSTSSGAG